MRAAEKGAGSGQARREQAAGQGAHRNAVWPLTDTLGMNLMLTIIPGCHDLGYLHIYIFTIVEPVPGQACCAMSWELCMPIEAWLWLCSRQAITLPEGGSMDMRLLAQDFDVTFLQAADNAGDQNLLVRPIASVRLMRQGCELKGCHAL